MKSAHLSTAYFPPIQYFCKVLRFPKVIIESQEHFLKQSYRNRCSILSSNGIENLTVPVKKANSGLPIKTMQIDYSEDWQKQHQRALEAAYNSSPFYEYYIDDFNFVFQERIEKLWELNYRILSVCCELLEINSSKIAETSSYKKDYPYDFRNNIHPKETYQKFDNSFSPYSYIQTFSEKYPFHPNLSILDLLFNLGTEAEIYLIKSSQII